MDYEIWEEIGKEIGEILDLMFAGKLLETLTLKKEIVEEHMKNITNYFSTQSKRNHFSHSILQRTIRAIFFDLLGWDPGFEIPSGKLHPSHRYDVVAQKGSRTIVVEIKPKITAKNLDQVLGYISEVKRRFPESRVFLGTDLLNFDLVFRPGEIRDIIFDMAKKNGLGVIFVAKFMFWFLPAEFFMVLEQFK
nr:hypothetical protein [Candidatus Freyarchaeota archaeon]